MPSHEKDKTDSQDSPADRTYKEKPSKSRPAQSNPSAKQADDDKCEQLNNSWCGPQRSSFYDCVQQVGVQLNSRHGQTVADWSENSVARIYRGEPHKYELSLECRSRLPVQQVGGGDREKRWTLFTRNNLLSKVDKRNCRRKALAC